MFSLLILCHFLWFVSNVLYLLACKHDPVIILGMVTHWLWSQNAGNGILESHTIKCFRGGACPLTTLEAHGSGYAAPKTSLFLVYRVGMSDVGILCLCCKLYHGIFFLCQGFWYFAEKKQNFVGFSGANSRKNRPISRDFRGKKVKIRGTIGQFRAIFEGEKSKFEKNRPISRDFSGKKSIFEGFSGANS